MNTAYVAWLLISVGSAYHGASASPSNVVARFADQAECSRVAAAMKSVATNTYPALICVQAKVLP